MTPSPDPPSAPRRARSGLGLAAAVLAAVPAVAIRLAPVDWPPPVQALVFGLAIVGAAFLLSWAGEVAQLDISAGVAIALLALVAVLPEYVVDFVFARDGGNAVERFGPSCAPPGPAAAPTDPCSLALANMTGSNRLLIGVGWAMVVLVAWWRRRRDGDAVPARAVTLERSHAVEVAFLTVASAYALTLPLRRSLTLVDAAVLVTVFVLYTVRIAKAPAEEPELVGPARLVGDFRTGPRWAAVLALFAVAGTVIFLCAESFADNLVASGASAGISEFLLVQWLAPLASEAPELLVAGLYAWRLNTDAAIGTLVSSKVYQWTLLVGTLPVTFAVASGSTNGLRLVGLQREELFVTAGFALLALALLSDLTFTVREAWVLFALYAGQFVLGAAVPDAAHSPVRLATGALFTGAALTVFARGRARTAQLLRHGLRTPYTELVEAD